MRNMLLVVVIALLSGCAQYQWMKPGASQLDFQQDGYVCSSEAARLYPPQQVPMQIGSGYTSPSHTSCNPFGISVNCTTTGGQYTPPSVVYVDGNEDNRTVAARQCMAMKGWRIIRVK